MTTDNPHHDSLEWALNPECPWGVPAVLETAMEAELEGTDIRLESTRVTGPVRLPEGRSVVRRVVLEFADQDERAELVVDIPYVARSGGIILDGRDVAPIGFLRLRPGTYHVEERETTEREPYSANGESVLLDCNGERWTVLDEAEEQEDKDDWQEPDSSGPYDDHEPASHDEDEEANPESDEDLLELLNISAEFADAVPGAQHAPSGRSISQWIHVPQFLAPVTLTRIEDGRKEPTVHLHLEVPGLGRCEPERAKEMLADPEQRRSGQTGQIVAHLEKVAAADPNFDPAAFLDGQVVGGKEFTRRADLHGDLENCRVILAGQHIARAVAEGARRAATAVAKEPLWAKEPWTLRQRVGRAETVLNGRVKRLVHGGRPDPDGGTFPFESLDDTNPLSRFEHCRKVSRLGEGGTGTKGRVADALRDIHPSQLGRLCPFNTPESDRVGLVRHLTLDAELDAEGFFAPIEADPMVLPAPKLLSASALLLPLLNHDDAVRGVLAAKSLRQFVPLVEPELPLVRTGFEAEVTERFGASVRAETDCDVTIDGLILRLTKGNRELADLPLRNHPRRPPETGTDSSRLVCIDQIDERPTPATSRRAKAKRGQLLTRSPGTVVDESEALLAPGVNATCVVMPFRGLTIEDAIVVSASLAQRMRSVHIESIVERLGPGETLDRRVTTLAGQPLAANQELFCVIAGDPTDLTGSGVLRSVTSPFDGVVMHADVLKPESGERIVQLLVRVERPLRPGDKLTARHGNKGVVSAVLPDEEMPLITDYRGDGGSVPADMVISPFGPLRRMVIGLFHELALGRVASATSTPAVVAPIGHIGTDRVKSALQHAPVGATATVSVDGSGTFEDVTVGTLYVVKLNHLADRKLQSQSWSPESPLTGQPSRTRFEEQGRRIGRPQRLGEMEFWALQAYGAYSVIADAMGARRGSRGEVSGSLRVVLDHFHAAGVRALLHLSNGRTVSSLDDAKLERITDPVVSISFDFMERTRLEESQRSKSISGQLPGEILPVDDVLAELAAARREARNASPRPDDKRKRKTAQQRVFSSVELYPPTDEVECACGRSSGHLPGTSCARCGRIRRTISSSSQLHHLGYIDLGFPVVHPWVANRFWSKAREVAKVDHDTFDLLLEDCNPVEAKIASPDEQGSLQWKLDSAGRKVPPAAKFIAKTPSQTVRLIERLVELFELRAATREDRPPNGAEKKQQTAARNALRFTLSYMAVLPPAQRASIPTSDGRLVNDPLTGRYWSVAEQALSLRREIEKAAEPLAERPRLVGAHTRLTREVHRVLGTSNRSSAGEGTIAHRLRFKEGLLRRYLLGASQWRTAFGVMAPEPELLPHQVALPQATMRDLSVRPGDVVVVNRNPTLLRTEMLGMSVTESPDDAMRVPPSVIPMLAGDFDGDTITIHSPVTFAAAAEVQTLMHPARNLRAPGTGDPLVYAGEELALDLSVAARLEAAAAKLHTAVSSDSGIDAAAVALRDAYVESYVTATGRGSVGFSHLHDPDRHSDRLKEAERGGLKADQRRQVLTEVGTVSTYATRLLGESPIAIKGNFLQGLDTSDLISNARAAMAKLGDKKLATPKAGDFTKTLIEALYDVTVVEGNCQTKARIQLDQLSVRAARRKPRTDSVEVRSPLQCNWLRDDPSTVCQACYGADLTTGKPAANGLRVGLLAAQAIGERGTQLALKAIHVGSEQTELTRVLTPLVAVTPHAVPTASGGGLVDEGRESMLVDDPLAVVHLFRWVYTFDSGDGRTDRIAPGARPSIDDIHLELALASLSFRQRMHWKPMAERDPDKPGPSALTASMLRLDPLARATVRGNVRPVLRAAETPELRSSGSWRTRFLLHPTRLAEDLGQ